MGTKTTLRNYLAYLNREGEDVDVAVDGIDSIAYCPSYVLTDAGKEYFKEALDRCYIEKYQNIVEWDSDDTDDEDGIPKCAHLAWELLSSLAGYCSVEEFGLWFVDANEVSPYNTIKCSACWNDIDVDNDTYYKLYDSQYCANCITVVNR